MKSEPRADKLTVRLRVEEVLQMRLAGAEFLDIRKHAVEQGWNVSERQLWRYIRAGDKRLARTLDKDRDRLINRHIAQRRALFNRALSQADYGTASRILKDEAELLGLYPAKKRELTGAEGTPLHPTQPTIDLTPEQQIRGIRAILARMKRCYGSDDHITRLEDLIDGTVQPDGTPPNPESKDRP